MCDATVSRPFSRRSEQGQTPWIVDQFRSPLEDQYCWSRHLADVKAIQRGRGTAWWNLKKGASQVLLTGKRSGFAVPGSRLEPLTPGPCVVCLGPIGQPVVGTPDPSLLPFSTATLATYNWHIPTGSQWVLLPGMVGCLRDPWCSSDRFHVIHHLPTAH